MELTWADPRRQLMHCRLQDFLILYEEEIVDMSMKYLPEEVEADRENAREQIRRFIRYHIDKYSQPLALGYEEKAFLFDYIKSVMI